MQGYNYQQPNYTGMGPMGPPPMGPPPMGPPNMRPMPMPYQPPMSDGSKIFWGFVALFVIGLVIVLFVKPGYLVKKTTEPTQPSSSQTQTNQDTVTEAPPTEAPTEKATTRPVINCAGYWDNDECDKSGNLKQHYVVTVPASNGGAKCKDDSGKELINGQQRIFKSDNCPVFDTQVIGSLQVESKIPTYSNPLTLDLTRKYDFVIMYEPEYNAYICWIKNSPNFEKTFATNSTSSWYAPKNNCSEAAGCVSSSGAGNTTPSTRFSRFQDIVLGMNTTRYTASMYGFNKKKGIPGIWDYDYYKRTLTFNDEPETYSADSTLDELFGGDMGRKFTHDNIKTIGVIKRS